MATAVRGCIITKDPGEVGTIHYKKVCESCGHTLPVEGQHSGSLRRGNTFRTEFKCPKCGNKQKVEILGG